MGWHHPSWRSPAVPFCQDCEPCWHPSSSCDWKPRSLLKILYFITEDRDTWWFYCDYLMLLKAYCIVQCGEFILVAQNINWLAQPLVLYISNIWHTSTGSKLCLENSGCQVKEYCLYVVVHRSSLTSHWWRKSATESVHLLLRYSYQKKAIVLVSK